MLPVRTRLRPVLLTRDADVVAEVASLASLASALDDEAESIVLTIGHALAPNAPAALLRLAALLAVQRRWHATLARLLPALVAASASTAASTPPEGEETLLHAAARCGDARIVAALLQAGAACGACGSESGSAGGATPLHLAAALPDASARSAVLVALVHDASAPLAWLAARDAAGRTPAQVAAAHGNRNDDGTAAALDTALRGRLLAARAAAVAALAHVRDERGVFAPQHALEVAAAALAAAASSDGGSSSSRAALDAIAILSVLAQVRTLLLLLPLLFFACVLSCSADAARARLHQMPNPPQEAPDADNDTTLAQRMRALLRALPRLRPRMPGAFVDAALERAWLANSAAACRVHDACVFAVCGLIHLVEIARLTPPARAQLAAQLACALMLLLALPALTAWRGGAWYLPRRETLITLVRLSAAAAGAPLWLRRGAVTTAPGYSGGWLSRFPLLFLAVRLPLHSASSVRRLVCACADGRQLGAAGHAHFVRAHRHCHPRVVRARQPRALPGAQRRRGCGGGGRRGGERQPRRRQAHERGVTLPPRARAGR